MAWLRCNSWRRDTTAVVVRMLVATMASALAVATARAGSDTAERRFYVQLVDALVVRTAEGISQTRTLQFACMEKRNRPGAIEVSDFWVVNYGKEMPAKWLRLALTRGAEDGDKLEGEVKVAADHDRDAGTWTFALPLTAGDSEGTFSGSQGGQMRRGRVEIVSVHEVRGGGRGLRAWLPAGSEPVRGLLIWGNVGQADDRWEVMRDHWLGFCRLHRFALVAQSGYFHEMLSSDGRALERQLAELATRTGRTELNSAPVIFTGHSNGGMKAWEYSAAHAERVVAFTMSRAAIEGMAAPSSAMLGTPAMFLAGELDDPGYNAGLLHLFVSGRRTDAPWSIAVEPRTGHEVNDAHSLWLPFFDWAVRSRLPPENGAAPTDPALRAVDRARGWVVVQRNSQPGEPFVGPAGTMAGSVQDQSWFPDQTMVWAYLGYVSRDPWRLELAPRRHRFRAGETTTLQLRPFSASAWATVQVLINGNVRGVLDASGTIALPSMEPGVYVASVLATPAGPGSRRISRPVAWVVEPAPAGAR